MNSSEQWGNTTFGVYEYEPLKDFPYSPEAQTTVEKDLTFTPTAYVKLSPMATASTKAPDYVSDLNSTRPTRKLTVDEYNYYYTLLKTRTDLPLYAQVALADNLLADLYKVYIDEPAKQTDEFLIAISAKKAILPAEELKPTGGYYQERAKFTKMIQATLDDPQNLTASETSALKNMAEFGSSIFNIARIRAAQEAKKQQEEVLRQEKEVAKVAAEEQARDEKYQSDQEIRFSEYVKENIDKYLDSILSANILAPYLTAEHKYLNEEMKAIIKEAVVKGELPPDEALKTYAQGVINLIRPLPENILVPEFRTKYLTALLTDKLEPYQMPLLSQLG